MKKKKKNLSILHQDKWLPYKQYAYNDPYSSPWIVKTRYNEYDSRKMNHFSALSYMLQRGGEEEEEEKQNKTSQRLRTKFESLLKSIHCPVHE